MQHAHVIFDFVMFTLVAFGAYRWGRRDGRKASTVPYCELVPSLLPSEGVASGACSAELAGKLTSYAGAVAEARKQAESPEQGLVECYRELVDIADNDDGDAGFEVTSIASLAAGNLTSVVAKILAWKAA